MALPTTVFDFAFDLFRRSGDTILVHDFFLQQLAKVCTEARTITTMFNFAHGPEFVVDLGQLHCTDDQ